MTIDKGMTPWQATREVTKLFEKEIRRLRSLANESERWSRITSHDARATATRSRNQADRLKRAQKEVHRWFLAINAPTQSMRVSARAKVVK